ncbi:hypothetical protein [Sorangium sp. So ce117]|uniref:hypothetical protein n=1 Tax=Sorangium sp. So ce117 TaxID=3133277 RepID=UPI003F648F85
MLYEVASDLARSFDAVRLELREEVRELRRPARPPLRRRSAYLDVSRDGESFSFLSVWDRGSAQRVRRWAQALVEHLDLPAANAGELDAEVLELRPPAFGYLLHEALGHRLEGDDHVGPIVWRRFKALSFDVWDTPGHPEWIGFTPWDDEGTSGRPVRLLAGRDGRQELLRAATGNLRAVDGSWHPLVRQRCLEVRPLCPGRPPPRRSALVIGDIAEGSFHGDHVVLRSSRQLLRQRDGRVLRLPPLRLTLPLDIVLGFSHDGDVEVWNPGAGCHKGLQRGLPVTFCCPAAWRAISDNHEMQVEVLGET